MLKAGDISASGAAGGAGGSLGAAGGAAGGAGATGTGGSAGAAGGVAGRISFVAFFVSLFLSQNGNISLSLRTFVIMPKVVWIGSMIYV